MEQCHVNIGARGRRDRMRFGVVMVGVTVVLAIALLAGDASKTWRLAVFVPAVLAGVSVFQARDGT